MHVTVPRILAIGACLVVVISSSAGAELLGNMYLDSWEGFDGGGGGGDGGDSDPGRLDIDRSYVWANATSEDETIRTGHSFVNSDSSGGDITCYDLFATSGGTHSAVRIYSDCDSEYALEIPNPQIGLQAAEYQRKPPCDDSATCVGSWVLIPVYGEWSGRIELVFSQNRDFVSSHNITFPLQSYGLLQVAVGTDFTGDYAIKTKLYNDNDELVDETPPEQVNVTSSNSTWQVLHAEWANWGGRSDYLYAAGWQASSNLNKWCAVVRDTDGNNRLNARTYNSSDTGQDHEELRGGSPVDPEAALIGSDCNNLSSVQFEKTAFGT